MLVQVNYIKEVSAFMAFAMEEELSGNAQLLWHALMHLANSRGDGSLWPTAIQISNRRLLLFLPYSEDTLSKARQELERAGLIAFTEGNRGERPSYGMRYFSSCAAHGAGTNPTFSTPSSTGEAELSTDIEDTPQLNPQDNPQISGQTPGYPAELSHTYTLTYTDDEDEYCGCSKTQAGVRLLKPPEKVKDEIYAASRDYIGPATPRAAAVDRLAKRAQDLRASPPLVREAIRQACRQNAENPLRYAEAMLQGWCEAGYETIAQVHCGQLARRMDEWRSNAPLDEPLGAGLDWEWHSRPKAAYAPADGRDYAPLGHNETCRA